MATETKDTCTGGNIPRNSILAHRFLPWAILGGLCYCLFFFGLGSYPLLDVDEPRYAEAGREMLELQNWITPYFNYVVRFDKPVFFYWLVALAYSIFDVSEFAARFFSAVSATLMTLALYGFSRFWVNGRFAFITSLVFATSLMVVGVGRMSITDMTLTALMGTTLLSLYLVAQHSPRWWLMAGVLSALACLTKGPVGIVLPGTILLCYAFFTRRLAWCFLTPWFLGGLGIWAFLTVPWYVMAWQENGFPFIDALFLHNVTRFSGVVSGHSKPWFFFFPVLLIGFLPWSVFLPALFLWILQTKKRQEHQPTQQPINTLLPPSRLWDLALYGLVWSVVTFLFFTSSQTKLLTYILPLFPGIALSTGCMLYGVQMAPKEWPKVLSWLKVSTWFLVAIIVVSGTIFVLNAGVLLPREASHMGGNPANALPFLFFLLGTLAAGWFFLKGRVGRAVFAQGMAIVLLAMVAVQGVLPRVTEVTQGPMLEFLDTVGPAPLATYEIQRPSLTYYSRRQVPHIAKDDDDKLSLLLETYGHLFVITKQRHVARLTSRKMVQPGIHWEEVPSSSGIYSLIRLEKSVHTHP